MQNITHKYSRRDKLFDFVVKAILIWVIFQDFVLAFLYKITANRILISVLLYSKDVVFILLLIPSFFKSLQKYPILCLTWAFFSCFSLTYSFIFVESSITMILSNFRAWILLPGFFLIGKSIKNKSGFEMFLHRYLTNFMFVIAAFGILDYVLDITVGTITFWRDFLQIGKYYADIKNEAGKLVNNLPGNFYGYLNGQYFARKRLVSFWAGPLTSGYSLLIPYLYCFIISLNKKQAYKYYFYSAVFFISILLTYTRIIMILAVLSSLVVFIYIKPSKRFLLFPLTVISVLFLFVYRTKVTDFFFDGSTAGHLSSLFEAFNDLTITGSGLGDFKYESTFLTCAVQNGILGLFLYISTYFYCSFQNNVTLKNRCTNYEILMSISVKIGMILLFITGLISLQLTAYTTIVPSYIMSGVFSSTKTNTINNEYDSHNDASLQKKSFLKSIS